MKKLILLALTSVLAISAEFTTFDSVNSQNENKRLCKAYIKKAHSYQETMRSDKLALATLDVYKDKVVTHCGAVTAKQPLDPFAAKIVLKNVEAKMKNVELCKTAIETAQAYKDIENKDESIFDSYKKDVVANCGIISAKV
jgi:hypothetical protein